MQRIRTIILSLFVVLILGIISCQRNMLAPMPELPEEFLSRQPDTLSVGEQKLVLHTYLWRDFMPIIPPGGKPLFGLIMVDTVDSSAINFKMDSGGLYLIQDHRVWPVVYDDKEPAADHPDRRPFRLLKIFHNGPKLQPRSYVDVVVRLQVNGKQKFLRAAQQFINVTF